MAKIDALFKLMKQQGASDLHISSGAPPIFRLNGEMEKLNYPPLTDQQARALLFEILTDEQRAGFEGRRDIDFAYALPEVARFRGNLMETHRGIAGVFRIIPSKILTADQLAAGRIAQTDHAQERAGAGHRPDRLGEIDHPGGDDRSDQQESP